MSQMEERMNYHAGTYECIVVGGGHAGCEAALATARLGCSTLMLVINIDSIALMACNPAIGGTSKGHLVREIDALGGEMGINIDHTFIQSRLLNTGKGPAVHSLRAQADKKAYQMRMIEVLENQDGLDIKQGEVTELWVENNRIQGVKMDTGAVFTCTSLVLATGVYLNGRVIIGELSYSSGPSGIFPANALSDSLQNFGLQLQRFKTGTPARVDKRSLDFSKMIIQPGDEKIIPFSFVSDTLQKQQVPCWLTYTNQLTHDIIRKNLHRSPLYSGDIKGIGPRYCPSIEDKVVRFADKECHQLFIEPEGLHTNEMYVQGMSSSMPEDVQIDMLRTISGLEKVKMMRTAYAIEYDCLNPTQLQLSLECKTIQGLFTAGQINGSSGYEEAAAQGIIAGINAALQVKKKDPLLLNRSDGYIGVLIDDLVTKGTKEPYRMMTSRAEYRLLLRQDNADMRLTEIGYQCGLVTPQRYHKYQSKMALFHEDMDRLKRVTVAPSPVIDQFIKKHGGNSPKSGMSLYELLRRPEIKYKDILEIDPSPTQIPEEVREQVEIHIKYEGYIGRQMQQVEHFRRMEKKMIPIDVDYTLILGLRLEARQKLQAIKPASIGQASRISGVSPSDIAVLLVFLEKYRRMKEEV